MEEEIETGFKSKGSARKDRSTDLGIREAQVQIFYFAVSSGADHLCIQRDYDKGNNNANLRAS